MTNFDRFTVFSVLCRAWTVIWKKPASFILITIFYMITITATDYYIEGLKSHFPNMLVWISTIRTIMFFLVAAIFHGILANVVLMLLINERASILESLKCSVSRILTVVISTVLIAIAYILASVVIFIPIIGILTYIVFSVVFFIKWYVFPQVCVIEQTDAFECLSRSSELTKGYRQTIFFILLIGVVFLEGILYIFHPIHDKNVLSKLLYALIMLILWTYYNVVPTVVYYNLRIAKESPPDCLADMYSGSTLFSKGV